MESQAGKPTKFWLGHVQNITNIFHKMIHLTKIIINKSINENFQIAGVLGFWGL
jgi:hypothetical protein